MESGFYMIESILKDCSPVEQKVARFLLDHPKAVVSSNVQGIAKAAGVSSAAVNRLCKRLKLNGFKELKVILGPEVYADHQPRSERLDFTFGRDSTMPEIIDTMIAAYRHNLETLDKAMSRKNMERAAALIHKARVVHLVGIGASGIAALDFSQKLARLGKPSFYSADSHLQITDASTMSREDALCAFSYSGKTQEIINCAKEARKTGAKVITVTNISANPLSKLGDICLFVPHSESLTRYAATISRLNELMVVDMLFNAIIVRNFDASIESIEKTKLLSGYAPRKRKG